ncbi:MAG: hypothetical protein E7Z89_01730 [Cyanobacteria bacterium SIG28]|nr:hypothetical protein [Cyanobacteria bacterium SIG28]
MIITWVIILANIKIAKKFFRCISTNMQVYNVQNNIYQNRNFKGWQREVTQKADSPLKAILHRNDTWFARDDFLNRAGLDFIVNKFKNVKEVNTYCYGCSDCAEVWTLLSLLKANYSPKIFEKFRKVLAFDYDPVAVQKAKAYKISIGSMEERNFYKVSDAPLEASFKVLSSELTNKKLIMPKKELKDKVSILNKDIRKDYKRIMPENSLVMARNFMLYLENQESGSIMSLINKLSEQMQKNSILMVGNHEIRHGWVYGISVQDLLIHYGFKPIENQPFMYEK